ncbi:MAG TPA: glycosyltransferase family 1 protein [Candidatus Acidoferrum sp.]|jgi:glycosyltransferase involved in cell wall biosynthesis|nr:glycosyltransferase family 1 protein [Candidatus Acidoferrum sp.]
MNVGLSTSVIQRGQSGIAQYVFALVKALSQHTAQPDLKLFVLEEDLPLFDFAKEGASIIPVSESFRSPAKDILWHQTVLPQLARAHRLDVLHVPSYRRMLWARPCALVTTIHDLAPFHVARKYDWKRMFYGRVVARWLAQRQDKIIAVSQNTGTDILESFRLAAKKVSVIHNGLDHTRFFPDSIEAAKRLVMRRYDLRGPFFLYVSRLEHPGKNHVRLIEAFNRFKTQTRSEWQLVFGGSDWHGAQTIRAAVGQSQFSSEIRCLGFVANDVLPQLYRAASVFVYPSLFEGFGFPPLEAMACGCPVLCSTRGSLGEVVGEAAATVDPEDVTALKMQLGALAGDPVLRAKLRAAGLTRARRFDWQRTASKTLDVYAAALEAETAANHMTVLRHAGENSTQERTQCLRALAPGSGDESL